MSIKDLVTARIQALTHSNSPDVLSRVCDQLINSSLTANFPTIIIYELLVEQQFKNFWKVPRKEGWDHQKYGHQREATELALHPLSPLPPSELHMQGAPGLDLKEYGTSDQRPISAALNIGYFYGGAAPVYGTSYLVLRDNVKQRCTFTAGDSLEHHWKKGLYLSTVGTSDALVNVLYQMSDPALACVAKLALKISGPPDGKYLQYVEAQIFGGIDMTTDIRALVIDDDELNYWITAKHSIPESLKGKDPYIRSEAVQVLKSMIEQFCNMHNIILKYINTGRGDQELFSAEKVYKPTRFAWQR
jgi:hypothetical protein